MPELPEVEAARRAIQENCVGKRIVSAVVADDSKVIESVSKVDFERSLAGKTIVAAHRKGKHLWIQLDTPPFPSFHFGMTGAVYIKGVAVTKYVRSAVKDNEEWPSKYSKVFIELDDGLEFSFTDRRRLAKVRLLKTPTSVPPISDLGPDVLMEPMRAEEFVASLSTKKNPIKNVLLNQSIISGIGNWIGDEVLYQARIHPLQVASSLTKESCANLQKCIKEVLEKAVQVGADSSQYPNDWIFHYREKKPGKKIDGKKIEFITVGGRTTAFVPELQKLSGDQVKEVSANQIKGSPDNSDEDELETNDGENAKPKKKVNPRAQVKKKLPAKRKSKDESDDESDSEDESPQPKKGSKVKGQQLKKKLPATRKSEESDGDESESDDENAKPKKSTKPRAGQAKKKLQDKVNTDNEDEEILPRSSKKVSDSKGTKKTAQSGRSSKNLGKKLK